MNQRQVQPGMSVVASDGLLGTVEALQSSMTSSTAGDQDFVVRGVDETTRLVQPSLIERIVDDTIYLRVPGDSVPAVTNRAEVDRSDTRDERTIDSEEMSIPVFEERLQVDTRTVELGVAQVSKHIDEEIVQHTVPLRFEEVEVERVPANQIVDQLPAPFMDGDVLVVPVVEEEIVEVVVRRQLRVTEELRIRRVMQQRQETVDVPLRRERIDVNEVWHETPQSAMSIDPLADVSTMPATLQDSNDDHPQTP